MSTIELLPSMSSFLTIDNIIHLDIIDPVSNTVDRTLASYSNSVNLSIGLGHFSSISNTLIQSYFVALPFCKMDFLFYKINSND